MRSERFCAWFHKYRFVLLAGWILHATLLHVIYIGFPSWDAFSYRLPPMVELIQHGDLGLDHYNQWALHGYVPFAELAQLPFLYVFGLPGLLIGYPLVVFPLCVVAVYKLVKQLTGTVHGGNFGALAYAAIPLVNQQPFTGYIDFIVSAVVAYFIYAVLKLRESPRPVHAAIRVAIATLMFTMTRATGLYIGIMLLGLLCLALFVERTGGLRVRLAHRRALLITIAAFLVGATPAIAVQITKYLHHGSPLYPYQFNVLGMKIGTGVPTKDLFFYAGLADETLGNFARNAFGAWVWPLGDPMCFFDSRNLGGGWMLLAALAALPVFVRSATPFERWLVIACVLVSVFARDFWLPRWAYTIVVAICVIVGRAMPELARSGRRGRGLFWVLACLMLLHLARPEVDAWHLRTYDGIGPRLNVTESRRFRHGRDAVDPYPDLHAQFVIIEFNWNGFLIPIYGRNLTNEVLFTIPASTLDNHCVGLRPIVAAHPNVLFIDDQNLTADCHRECAITAPRGACRAYRYLGQHDPVTNAPWMAMGANSEGTRWLTSGWSYPEPWGVWSTGTDSILSIPAPKLDVDLSLDLRWFAAAAGMTVTLEVGGTSRTLTFAQAQQPQRDSLVFKATTSPVLVHIHVDHPFASGDGRPLGIGINELRLRIPDGPWPPPKVP